MAPIRRVTLRCLCDDLDRDWADTKQQRHYAEIRDAIVSGATDGEVANLLEAVPTTILAKHPLVVSFAAAFADDSPHVLRETISGLTQPHWWKQKASRWRGAATDSKLVGIDEVWLCSGGLRAEGESRDFYATFMSLVAAEGADRFLPTAADRTLQRVEAKNLQYEAWQSQVRLLAMIAVAQATESETAVALHIPGPSPQPIRAALLHTTVDVTTVREDLEELIEVTFTEQDTDHSRPQLAAQASDLVRGVIWSISDDWRALPGANHEVIWATVIDQQALDTAFDCLQHGRLPLALEDAELRFGVRAHYVPKTHIVTATVDGSPIRALCGAWIVPTTNPEGLEVCRACNSHPQGPGQ